MVRHDGFGAQRMMKLRHLLVPDGERRALAELRHDVFGDDQSVHGYGLRLAANLDIPDSIMGTSGEYIPNLGHIISKIDREVLQIMYMSQRTDLYNDWGEWSDTSFHMVGPTDDGILNFGVALFNGLPQPWVRGTMPDVDLADNNRLYGTATWSGDLLGFYGPSPIAGVACPRLVVQRLS